jgi:hypothetical protein
MWGGAEPVMGGGGNIHFQSDTTFLFLFILNIDLFKISQNSENTIFVLMFYCFIQNRH